ncbi:MAG: hypothetical protein ACR2GR_09505 [Rhodothermales bacterium]
MAQIDDLSNAALTALSEHTKRRMCLIGGVGENNDFTYGTGNTLCYEGNFYIVTCKHVADDFFRAQSNSQIILWGNRKYDSTLFSYFQQTDDNIDIAVIKVDASVDIQDFYTDEDFEIIDHFGQHDFSKVNVFVSGLPGSLSYEDDAGIQHRWFSLLTLPSKERSSSDFLYCDFDFKSPKYLNQQGLQKGLPNPQGMSGCFALSVPPSSIPAQNIWSPNEFKVIGLQVSWNQESWIKCSNIKHLFEMLN